MKKYDVLISRTGYSSRRFEVEAENETEAEEKAMDMAGDYEFSEGDAEYNCESVVLLDEPDTDDDVASENGPMTVWVFCADQISDADVMDVITEVFFKEEDALKYLHDFVHGDEGEYEYAKKRGWMIEYDEPNHFRAYEDGHYCHNHTEATVEWRRMK